MKKDTRYEKIFEGTLTELREYYSETFMESVDKFFGNLDELKIGEQVDDVMMLKILKRKSETVYVMFCLTIDAMRGERNIQIPRKIRQ